MNENQLREQEVPSLTRSICTSFALIQTFELSIGAGKRKHVRLDQTHSCENVQTGPHIHQKKSETTKTGGINHLEERRTKDAFQIMNILTKN